MGLPFICSVGMVPHFAQGYIYSEVLQTSFKLEFMKPRLDECVPQQDGQTPTFVAPTAQKESPKKVTVLDPNSPTATSC